MKAKKEGRKKNTYPSIQRSNTRISKHQRTLIKHYLTSGSLSVLHQAATCSNQRSASLEIQWMNGRKGVSGRVKFVGSSIDIFVYLFVPLYPGAASRLGYFSTCSISGCVRFKTRQISTGIQKREG